MHLLNKKGFLILLSHKSLQAQFSYFCKQNSFPNLEEALNYFTIFGGLDIKLDLSLSIEENIKINILKKYYQLKGDVHYFTSGYGVSHAVLTGISQGDRRTNSAFKRAKVTFEEGIKLVDELCSREIIVLEKSFQKYSQKKNQLVVSEKLTFNSPYLRFWFAFISPIYLGITEGRFEEFEKKFSNKQVEFRNQIFEDLSHCLLKKSFTDDKIVETGRYWDDELEIDLLAKTRSGKIIAGVCKYTNVKLKKSELAKLKEACAKAEIHVDIFAIFSKTGFTNELKALKSDELKLYSLRSFKALID